MTDNSKNTDFVLTRINSNVGQGIEHIIAMIDGQISHIIRFDEIAKDFHQYLFTEVELFTSSVFSDTFVPADDNVKSLIGYNSTPYQHSYKLLIAVTFVPMDDYNISMFKKLLDGIDIFTKITDNAFRRYSILKYTTNLKIYLNQSICFGKSMLLLNPDDKYSPFIKYYVDVLAPKFIIETNHLIENVDDVSQLKTFRTSFNAVKDLISLTIINDIDLAALSFVFKPFTLDLQPNIFNYVNTDIEESATIPESINRNVTKIFDEFLVEETQSDDQIMSLMNMGKQVVTNILIARYYIKIIGNSLYTFDDMCNKASDIYGKNNEYISAINDLVQQEFKKLCKKCVNLTGGMIDILRTEGIHAVQSTGEDNTNETPLEIIKLASDWNTMIVAESDFIKQLHDVQPQLDKCIIKYGNDPEYKDALMKMQERLMKGLLYEHDINDDKND